MKRWLLGILATALMVSSAEAYVQVGHIQPQSASNPGDYTAPGPVEPLSRDKNKPRPRPRPGSKPGPGTGETPTQPVPEPGTMALTSMGLLALGAAARRRRGGK
jgi:hypothetical protein